MDVRALTGPDQGPPLGRSRSRVLDLLRAAGAPLGVQEVADSTGLHPNTARFHLDGLVEAGLAFRESQPRPTPGRPSMAYRATDGGGPAGGRRYRLLAEMLTSLITGIMPEPAKGAAEAGRQWGSYLTEQPPPYHRPGDDEAIGKLRALLEELGFAPEAVTDGKEPKVLLHQCPFREIAEHHQDVVCSLHLGLMQGALAQMRAPLGAGLLEPFAEPSLCIAHLTARGEPRPAGHPSAAPGD